MNRKSMDESASYTMPTLSDALASVSSCLFSDRNSMQHLYSKEIDELQDSDLTSLISTLSLLNRSMQLN